MEWHDDPWSEVFDDDYLYFYADRLDAEHSERETELIVGLLDLPPGSLLLDAPCGHGRIANRLAARGLRVVGLDSNAGFLRVRSPRRGRSRGRCRVRPRRPARAAQVGSLRRSGQLVHVGGLFRRRGQPPRAGWVPQSAQARRAAAGRADQPRRADRQIPAGGSQLVALTERGDDLMIDRVHFDLAAGRSRTERIIVRDGHVRRVRFWLAQPTLSELSASLRQAGFTEIAAHGARGEPLRPDSRRMLIRRLPSLR